MFVCPPPRQRSQLIRPVQYLLVPPLIPGETKSIDQLLNHAGAAASIKKNTPKKGDSRHGRSSSMSTLETNTKSKQVPNKSTQFDKNCTGPATHRKNRNTNIPRSRLGSSSDRVREPKESIRSQIPSGTARDDNITRSSAIERETKAERTFPSRHNHFNLSTHDPHRKSTDKNVIKSDRTERSSLSKSNKRCASDTSSSLIGHRYKNSRKRWNECSPGNESLKRHSQSDCTIATSKKLYSTQRKEEKVLDTNSKFGVTGCRAGGSIVKSQNSGQKYPSDDTKLTTMFSREKLIEKTETSMAKKTSGDRSLPHSPKKDQEESSRKRCRKSKENFGSESKEDDLYKNNAVRLQRVMKSTSLPTKFRSEKKSCKENKGLLEDTLKVNANKHIETLNAENVSENSKNYLSSEREQGNCPNTHNANTHHAHQITQTGTDRKALLRKKFSLKRFIKRDKTGYLASCDYKKAKKQDQVILNSAGLNKRNQKVNCKSDLFMKVGKVDGEKHSTEECDGYEEESSDFDSRTIKSSNSTDNLEKPQKHQNISREKLKFGGGRLDRTDRAYMFSSRASSVLKEDSGNKNEFNARATDAYTKIGIGTSNTTLHQLKSTLNKSDNEYSNPISLLSEKCRNDFGDFSWLACTDFSGEYPFRVSSPRSPPSIRSGFTNSPSICTDRPVEMIKSRISSPPDLVKGLDKKLPMSPKKSPISSDLFDDSKAMRSSFRRTHSNERLNLFEHAKNKISDRIVDHTDELCRDENHLPGYSSNSSESSESSSDSDYSCSESSSSSAEDEQDGSDSAVILVPGCYNRPLPLSCGPIENRVDYSTDRNCDTAAGRDLSIFTAEYLSELQELQRRIMTSTDCRELERVFALVAETGNIVDSNNHYDFDLCGLDQRVIRKLQRCLLMI